MCEGDKVIAAIKKARDLNTTRPELLVRRGGAEPLEISRAGWIIRIQNKRLTGRH
jgi:hypothetical protein